MKQEVDIPLITTNRINMPDVAEKILAEGHADMVSMARPFLADAELIAHQLGEGGVVALSVGMAADEDTDLSRGLDPDGGAFEQTGASSEGADDGGWIAVVTSSGRAT